MSNRRQLSASFASRIARHSRSNGSASDHAPLLQQVVPEAVEIGGENWAIARGRPTSHGKSFATQRFSPARRPSLSYAVARVLRLVSVLRWFGPSLAVRSRSISSYT